MRIYIKKLWSLFGLLVLAFTSAAPVLAQNAYSPVAGVPRATHETLCVTNATSTAVTTTCSAASSVTVSPSWTITQPNTPRNVWVAIYGTTITTTTANFTVFGINQYGYPVSDLLTATSATYGIGSVAFTEITTITCSISGLLAARTITARVFMGGRLGLVTPVGITSDVFQVSYATAFAAPANVAYTAYTVNPFFGTIEPTTLAANSQLDVWIRSTNRDPLFDRRSRN